MSPPMLSTETTPAKPMAPTAAAPIADQRNPAVAARQPSATISMVFCTASPLGSGSPAASVKIAGEMTTTSSGASCQRLLGYNMATAVTSSSATTARNLGSTATAAPTATTAAAASAHGATLRSSFNSTPNLRTRCRRLCSN
jgi:hypothetical protein